MSHPLKTSVMDNTIKNWIVTSLPKGYTVEQLQSLLAKSGFPTEEIKEELAFAAPYITAANKIKTESDKNQIKLNKREALLKTLDRQMRAMPAYWRKPEKVKLPPFKRFMKEYYSPLRPGLFGNVLDNCEVKNWTPRNLVDKVGADTIVEVQYGREADRNHERNPEQYKKQVRFADYIGMVESAESSNNFYMTSRNYFANARSLRNLTKDLSDNLGDGYLSAAIGSGYMHLWIGPKGTITPAHHDFLNNFFIQVYGRKHVRLVPAMQVPYMYNNDFVYSDVDLQNPDFNLYPDFAKATVMEIEVGPGDGLFIPIGWWHELTSLTPSISISCTNINAVGDYSNIFVNDTKAFGHII